MRCIVCLQTVTSRQMRCKVVVSPKSLRAKILPIFKNNYKRHKINFQFYPTCQQQSLWFFFIKDSYNYLSENIHLFGFRSGASMEHNQFNFSDEFLKLFDEMKIAIATFMVLSKVFECVDHNNLLSTLTQYMTSMQLHSNVPIVTYISGREHFVTWNQIHSPSLSLNIGLLQTSILGRLLFLIYINAIVNSCNILSFVLFPDDTTVYVCSTWFN